MNYQELLNSIVAGDDITWDANSESWKRTAIANRTTMRVAVRNDPENEKGVFVATAKLRFLGQTFDAVILDTTNGLLVVDDERFGLDWEVVGLASGRAL